MKDASKQVKLTVWKNRMKYEFLIPAGKNLRKVLIEKGGESLFNFQQELQLHGKRVVRNLRSFRDGLGSYSDTLA